MKDVNFNELVARAYENAKAHGFHDVEHEDGHWFMLVVCELAEAVEASFARKHITLERVGYELRFGRVAVTICRKRDVGVRPTIGSVGCERCTYFRGRCKSERIVLCAHRSYNTAERLLHGKHKEE